MSEPPGNVGISSVTATLARKGSRSRGPDAIPLGADRLRVRFRHSSDEECGKRQPNALG